MHMRVYLVGVLALALIVVLLWFNFSSDNSQDQIPDSGVLGLPAEVTVLQPPPVERQKREAPVAMFEHVATPEKQPVLPPLNESDLYARDQVAALSSDLLWKRWTNRDDLVRRFAVIVENAARGELPRRQLGFLVPQGKFKVIKYGKKIILDSQAYARYDPLVEAILTLPVEPSAKLLVVFQPLLAEALQELGIKEIKGQTLLFTAIDQVLATPVLHGDIELKQPRVLYRFADDKLESLSPLQKQIMRMGPSNTLRLQTFVRRLVLSLEGDML